MSVLTQMERLFHIAHNIWFTHLEAMLTFFEIKDILTMKNTLPFVDI